MRMASYNFFHYTLQMHQTITHLFCLPFHTNLHNFSCMFCTQFCKYFHTHFCRPYRVISLLDFFIFEKLLHNKICCKAGHRGPVGLCTCIIWEGRVQILPPPGPIDSIFWRRWKVEALFEVSISFGSGTI